MAAYVRAVTGLVPALAAAALAGCTTFGAARSARVTPGFATSVQVTTTTPVGDEPGWFWSYDCASDCNHSVVAPEIAFTWGTVGEESAPVAIAVGLSGTYPFADVYAQLGRAARPWGLGGRIATMGTWHELHLYARRDFLRDDRHRVLWNPGLFVVTGNSPNGANPGTFVAMVQSFGLEAGGEHVTVVPGAALVIGRGNRSSYGRDIGPFNAVFATFSVRLSIHRSPAAGRPD